MSPRPGQAIVSLLEGRERTAKENTDGRNRVMESSNLGGYMIQENVYLRGPRFFFF